MKIYDAAVVGQGPAGMTAALYLARSGCSVIMFEQLTPGGQIMLTEQLENYPGFPNGVKGYELVDLFVEHLKEYTIEKPLGEVDSISGKAGDFLITVDAREETYKAKTVIVCSGARHRPLGVENEKELIGRGVSYCALCDGNFYRNMPVAVVGGGNAALEESLYLAKIASKVHIIHRRDAFRGSKVYQDKLAELPNVVLHLDSVVTGLAGKEQLEGLELKNVKTGKVSNLPVEGVFVYIGYLPETGFLPEDIKKDEQGFLVTDTEMRTSISGIFAAGDIRSKLCRQVITAAGDGATAAQAAFVFMEQLDA